MTTPNDPQAPGWTEDGGATAVSSGQTSAYGLQALPDQSGAHAALASSGAYPALVPVPTGALPPPVAVDRRKTPATNSVAAPSPMPAAPAAPTAVTLDQRWGLTKKGIEDIESGAYQALPRHDEGGGVFGPITALIRRCKAWLNEEDKTKRSRIGMKVVIDETPSEGSVISLTRPERRQTERNVRDKARERAVRAEAQRLATQ